MTAADGPTLARLDPLAPDLLPISRARLEHAADGWVESDLRPFGLTRLTPVRSMRICDQTNWIYDVGQQVNVDLDGNLVVFEMPREQTWSTQKTVIDHQEWDDKVTD